MKLIITGIVCLFFFGGLSAQHLVGAWENFSTSEDGDTLRSVLIFSKGYQVLTTYKAKSGAFVHSNGGSWELKDNTLTEKVEFHTDEPELVGQTFSFKVNITENTLKIVDDERIFNRIDDGTPGKLQGAWLMSGRKRNGETRMRDTTQPRKTMKILSGTRFQWIAYNTETKQFMGTGGGRYTTLNGAYVEHIEFFSRDSSKAGLRLSFKFERVEGNWHHSGLSSKGQPIYEIWSKRD